MKRVLLPFVYAMLFVAVFVFYQAHVSVQAQETKVPMVVECPPCPCECPPTTVKPEAAAAAQQALQAIEAAEKVEQGMKGAE